MVDSAWHLERWKHPSKEWKKVFANYPFQHEAELITDLILGNDKEFFFSFENTPYRWINGSDKTNAVLIVPLQTLDYDEKFSHHESILRLLSILAFEQQRPITVRSTCASKKQYMPLSGAAISKGKFLVQQPKKILSKPDSQKKQLSLALYREGLSFNKPIYAFLCFFKIVQLPFPKEKNPGSYEEDVSKLKEWINHTVKHGKLGYTGYHWLKQFSGDDVGEYLVRRRHIAAHSILRSSADETVDPDLVLDVNQFRKDMDIIEELAKKCIEEFM